MYNRNNQGSNYDTVNLHLGLNVLIYFISMVTSSNKNIFRVTGLLWRETTGHRWIPLTKLVMRNLWCFLWYAPEQMVEQTIETPLIWDAIALIMTSLQWWILSLLHILFRISFCSGSAGPVYKCVEDSFLIVCVNMKFAELTHRGPVTHIYGGKLSIIVSDNAWAAPCHYLKQCWNIINWTFRNKLQWNFNRNSNSFIQVSVFENIVWKVAVILSRPQCVTRQKWLYRQQCFPKIEVSYGKPEKQPCATNHEI